MQLRIPTARALSLSVWRQELDLSLDRLFAITRNQEVQFKTTGMEKR